MREYIQPTLDFQLPQKNRKAEVRPTAEVPRDEDYAILNSPELRAEYIHYTDRLMAEIVDKKTDLIIFLDKSARPVSWLLRDLWPVIGPANDEKNSPVSMPEMKFLNIDREQWGAIVGRSEDAQGGINIDRIPEERINELRSVFTKKLVTPEDAPGAETILDGKNILIVDEVRASGDTLAISQGVISKAFPETESVGGFHWMGASNVKVDAKSGGRRIGELPIWYSDRDKTGRGIADRDTSKSSKSSSIRQRNGRFWLSTPFREGGDPKGVQLRQECAMVARELAAHRLPYQLAGSWDIETAIERIEAFNDISAVEYRRLRERAEEESVPFVRLYREYIADRAKHEEV